MTVMIMFVKFEKLKTTIISSLLGLILLVSSNSLYANTSNIRLEKEATGNIYHIKVAFESKGQVQDNRLSFLRAKSQLLKYIKMSSKVDGHIDMKHFTLIEKKFSGKNVMYHFSVKESDIQFYPK